jgi:hypothetical protein
MFLLMDFPRINLLCSRGMPARASRGGKRADVAQNALRVVEEAIGDILKPSEHKNPHAQALSSLGASKGGKARATNLSAKKRKAIAAKAAKVRWSRKAL